MATPLVNVFGSEIKVTAQPRNIARQYAGFAGGEGLTAMHLGSRGHQLIVRGTIRAATRALLRSAILAIENYLWYGAADYSFAGNIYWAVVWDKFDLHTDGRGKSVHFSSSWVFCEFTATGRTLI